MTFSVSVFELLNILWMFIISFSWWTELKKLNLKSDVFADGVQEEIDQVIGGRQSVTEDRKNLPYTDTVIHEPRDLQT